MKKEKTKGLCNYCKGEFTKTQMAKHLQGCEKREQVLNKSKTGRAKRFLISAEGKYAPQYWLFLEINARAKLKALDLFLRDIWLECCGHLSSFDINRTEYGDDPYSEMGLKSLNVPLQQILETGTTFYHQYDFGTPTELTLKVVAEQQGEKSKEPIKLLARNNPPEIKCLHCGEIATQICSQCLWSDEDAVFCDKCAESHDCDEEIFLPVANSPRIGTCAYTGEEY